MQVTVAVTAVIPTHPNGLKMALGFDVGHILILHEVKVQLFMVTVLHESVKEDDVGATLTKVGVPGGAVAAILRARVGVVAALFKLFEPVSEHTVATLKAY